MSQLADALNVAKLKILKYDPSKQRPVATNKTTMPLEKFCKALSDSLGERAIEFPDVFKALHDIEVMSDMLEAYAREAGLLVEKIVREIPAAIENLTLNRDMTANSRDDKYFLTTPDERVSPITGDYYIEMHGLNAQDAISRARSVIPEYAPRGKAGMSRRVLSDGLEHDVFNRYCPAPWVKYAKENSKKIPDRLPDLFVKLVNHLFPRTEEREYLFDWLHDSMFSRAFTYLVLCGAPGVGKNRLKLVMRALHGEANATDGKKSTFTERFNTQLDKCTLLWFDELHYDADMENAMKEVQNDTISVEAKGVDATRSTRIYASSVISNNKPRDNYIAFDARKFAPLVVTNKVLSMSMSDHEIDMLTQKVENEQHPGYDLAFIAQIGMWIKKHGKGKKWKNNEYKGPMFWTLAHTSMSRWQKKAAVLILEPGARPKNLEFDKAKGFKWSEVAEKANRKNGDRSLQFPDYTTVRAFFDVFRDSKGRKAFKTVGIPDNIMGDFYVKPLFDKVQIVTESSLMAKRSMESGKQKGKEYLDL
jgi:hypothetical protein